VEMGVDVGATIIFFIYSFFSFFFFFFFFVSRCRRKEAWGPFCRIKCIALTPEMTRLRGEGGSDMIKNGKWGGWKVLKEAAGSARNGINRRAAEFSAIIRANLKGAFSSPHEIETSGTIGIGARGLKIVLLR